MKTIIINAILKAKCGKEEELKQALLDVVKPSRNEAGCVQYTLHESSDNNRVCVL